MENRAILISIHPEYVEKIISGEKTLEFRRSWSGNQIKYLVIYATSPLQKIAAVAEIKTVFKGTRQYLWSLAMEKGGGISRRELFKYFKGSKNPVAIELSNVKQVDKDLDPKVIFGCNFKPPQSFTYLSGECFSKISKFGMKGK